MHIHQPPWLIDFKKIVLKHSPLKAKALNFSAVQYSAVLFMLLLATTLLSTTLFSAAVLAQEQQAEQESISAAELAQTLAPIALYPDTLLTHILIASTYPIEVIEAERWLNKHSTLTAAQIEKKAQQKDWDASIKTLLAFPRVMAKLSEDLSWMQKLGDAFLQDEARVLASIQTLRQQAEQAGSLANMDNVEVIKEQHIIIIEPAQPEIIYVPYYDTRVVYGRWHWSHYPPIYWHNPYYYAAHHGHFYWGHGVHISSHFFFSAFNWHNRHIVVNHYNRHAYHPSKKIVISHQAKRWSHQSKHRRGVAYSSGRLTHKYYGVAPSVHDTKVVRSTKVHSNKVHRNKVHSTKIVKQTGHHSTNKHYVADKQSHLNHAVHNQAKQKHFTQSKQHKQVQRQSVYQQPVSKPSPQQASKQSIRQSSRAAPKHLVRATKQHKSQHN
ncbi:MULTISPECIES: DUF3300 domain-containing protein [Colwellia]|uniref:DUF3300 domain-containing protein n=1 Tax=Colwellia marinimaniae TaxID=1513592 RepID=A0ABQ0MUU0_9GAMM|nr:MULTISPECIES: DUF3300 domain-containing protein [Colwellia]GAW96128.1 hypothetical protein MTCD1_01738 [Colwellia marinimaniae]